VRKTAESPGKAVTNLSHGKKFVTAAKRAEAKKWADPNVVSAEIFIDDLGGSLTAGVSIVPDLTRFPRTACCVFDRSASCSFPPLAARRF
jgi:hypothetical protein